MAATAQVDQICDILQLQQQHNTDLIGTRILDLILGSWMERAKKKKHKEI